MKLKQKITHTILGILSQPDIYNIGVYLLHSIMYVSTFFLLHGESAMEIKVKSGKLSEKED